MTAQSEIGGTADPGNMLQKEIDKLYREKKLQKREHDRDLAQKNTKINNLLTELENTKTDLEYF